MSELEDRKTGRLFQRWSSEPGDGRDRGTTSMCLPVGVHDAPPSPGAASILVVDDEDPMRRMLRATFEGHGHTVSEAHNGREALRQCREQAPDLVLLDMFMPECDGIETLLALRREMPEVKVVAMSGGGRHGLVDILDVTKKLGADRIFVKSGHMDGLRAVVRDLLAPPG